MDVGQDIPAAMPRRRGWCPGALRPMMSGDGLLVRIRPALHRLTARQIETVAACAERHGNGLIDLTSRANLQMRGIRPDGIVELQGRLADIGLLDPTIAIEARRNIVTSPLAGLDKAAPVDLPPLLVRLEQALAADASLDRLPAKTALVIDDGSLPGLDDIDADWRLRAVVTEAGPVMAVGVGGDANRCRWLGCCEPQALPETVLTLLRQSLDLTARTASGRMRDAWTDEGGEEMARVAALAPLTSPDLATLCAPGRRPLPLGPLNIGGLAVLGMAVPLGRLDVAMLRALGRTVGQDGEIRLTPWRSLLLPGQDAGAIPDLERHGFVFAAASPLLGIAACPGKGACASGTTTTRADARALAPSLTGRTRAGEITLHISGCAKGCAHPRQAPTTLVARAGRYDLVRHGHADASPLAIGLSLSDAARLLTTFNDRTDRP